MKRETASPEMSDPEMSVIKIARESVLGWEPAIPYDLVSRAAALVRHLIEIANPTDHSVWKDLSKSVSAEHVVSFTTHYGRPHRLLLCEWWHITNNDNFLIALFDNPRRGPNDVIGIVVGMCVALLAHCPLESSDPEFVTPISFGEMKRRLLAHIDMLAGLRRHKKLL